MKTTETQSRHSVQRMVRHQYRVVWKRVGLPEKKKRYEHLVRAQRFVMLLGPEPWKALGREPDEYHCCSGRECGCGGMTVREETMNHRENIPALEYVRIEQREITLGAWMPNTPDEPIAPKNKDQN
jgi:hypothetical protein